MGKFISMLVTVLTWTGRRLNTLFCVVMAAIDTDCRCTNEAHVNEVNPALMRGPLRNEIWIERNEDMELEEEIMEIERQIERELQNEE